MGRPSRRTLGLVLVALGVALGCASGRATRRSPEERIADAEEKIRDMEAWSRGEATVDAIWKAELELESARRDLAEERSRTAREADRSDLPRDH